MNSYAIYINQTFKTIIMARDGDEALREYFTMYGDVHPVANAVRVYVS